MRKIAADKNYRMLKRAEDRKSFTPEEIQAAADHNQANAEWMCPNCITDEDWRKYTLEQALRDGYIHRWSGE